MTAILDPEQPGRILPARPLTPRQLQILHLRAEGMTNQQIANSLWLSIETVKHHLKLVNQNTGCRNTTQAVALAIREGLI